MLCGRNAALSCISLDSKEFLSITELYVTHALKFRPRLVETSSLVPRPQYFAAVNHFGSRDSGRSTGMVEIHGGYVTEIN